MITNKMITLALMVSAIPLLLVGAHSSNAALESSMVASGQEGHGGDSYAAEFTAMADFVTNELNALPVDERGGVDVARLSVAINTTLVESTDSPLILDGNREVEAENYPDRKLIVLNRNSWNGMSFARRQLIVLHEYLSVAGFEDGNYEISAKVLLSFGIVEPSSSSSPTPGASTYPSTEPSSAPSTVPTTYPSTEPSTDPSPVPSTYPSTEPSTDPSPMPSTDPSTSPSVAM